MTDLKSLQHLGAFCYPTYLLSYNSNLQSKHGCNCVKRLSVILLILLLITPFALLWLAGISPFAVRDALGVGTGLTAKLACSGHYLSGFSDEQNRSDIASYSPAAEAVTLRHVAPDTIEAEMFGLARATARYYPGLGCTLQYPGMIDMSALQVPAVQQRQERWPQGEEIRTPDAQIQQLLQELLDEDAQLGLDTRALLVVRGGEIVAESYKNGVAADTPLLGWSMAKSITAIILGRMEALGLANVDDTSLFAAWSGDPRREISLQNLLQMSSGLEFDEPYEPGSDSTRMLFMEPSAAAVALASPLGHAPGSRFYYSSGTSNLLARFAWEKLGGDTQAFLDFFATELAAPLGLGHTYLELDASGVFVGSSYVYAPARDWARLGLLLLNDGEAAGRRLLPPGWVARASAPNSSDNDPRYGYQLWLNAGSDQLRWPDLDVRAYAMMGNRGQVVMMLPQLDALVVRLGWSAVDYPANERLARIQGLLAQ